MGRRVVVSRRDALSVEDAMIYIRFAIYVSIFMAGFGASSYLSSKYYAHEIETIKLEHAKQWEDFHVKATIEKTQSIEKIEAAKTVIEAMSDENTKSNDDLYTANLRLLESRKTVSGCAGTGKATRTSKNSNDATSAGGWYISKGNAESLVRESLRADKVANQLESCQSYIKKLNEVYK